MKYSLGAFPPGYPKEYAEDIAAIAAWRDRRDPKPFDAIFNRYARGLYYAIFFAIRYNGKDAGTVKVDVAGRGTYELPNSPEAIRLLNKTYYNALRGLADFRGEVSMGTWLHIIARNVVIDEAKFASRNPALMKARKIAFSEDLEEMGTEAEKVADAQQSADEALNEKQEGDVAPSILKLAVEIRKADGTPLLDPETVRLATLALKFRDDPQSLAKVLKVSVPEARRRVGEAIEAVVAVSGTPEFIKARKSKIAKFDEET